jgi:glycerol kinase
VILAIDQGTTNTKALLVDRSGKSSQRASVKTGIRTLHSNWVEQDPDYIWQAVQQAVTSCLQLGPDTQIEGVAISNQRETIVAWDRRTTQPVAPAIVWQCRRSDEICARLRRDGAEPLLRERTGLSIDTLYSASKIAWLLEQQPGLRERANAGEICFGTVDSWLIARLTAGKVHACDASNASRTQLLNLERCAWDDDLLHLFGIPQISLPEVRSSSGAFGHCSGFSALDGVPIVSAMGDSHAALAGHGRYKPGTIKATYGTGSSLMTLLPHLKPPSPGLATTIAWSLNGCARYALEGNIAMAGDVIAWLGEFLGLAHPTDDVIRLSESVPSSAGVYFIPAMSGLGAPHWDGTAKGQISGLTRTSRAAHLARAAVDAIAFQVRDVFDAMLAASGCDLPSLNADGGVTRNERLMQFQADLLGRPVLRSSCEDLSALGAAWFGGLALGWWNSLDDLTQLPQESTSFSPVIEATDREKLYHGWQTAVARARLRDIREDQVERISYAAQ